MENFTNLLNSAEFVGFVKNDATTDSEMNDLMLNDDLINLYKFINSIKRRLFLSRIYR
jgi:hypothetical protein